MFFRCLLISSFFLTLNLFSDPWGSDASIVSDNDKFTIAFVDDVSKKGYLKIFGVASIRFYQEVISKANCKKSNFSPSSSQYTLEAMKKYGFIQGWFMGCDRLMRENSEDWVYDLAEDGNHLVKLDPVI